VPGELLGDRALPGPRGTEDRDDELGAAWRSTAGRREVGVRPPSSRFRAYCSNTRRSCADRAECVRHSILDQLLVHRNLS
jgi:hypothetical protein